MLLHFSLYAVGSSAAADSFWRRVCYLAAQALLIVLIGVVADRFTVTLFLYLALVTEIASQVLSIRIVLLEGCACVLLFSLNVHYLFGREPVPLVPSHPVPFSMALVYALPAFVLIVGYALQQTRAHTRTQKLLRELEQAHRQLAEHAVRIEELTRAAERQRMARELHDTLAQGLTGLVLQLEAVKAHLVGGREERALEIVVQAIGRARSTLADARSAIDGLRTSAIPPTDLRRGLEEEARRFTAATGIPCTTRFSFLSSMSSACSEAILRSVAEGLLNVARHAGANQVWLDVTEHDEQLAIEVRDDGKGFDPAAVAGQGHYGLLGLRERARSLGGQLRLRTAPGEGTTLCFLLPTQTRGEVA
jgi:NarL family two-component system sensor histidine kinase YdfH